MRTLFMLPLLLLASVALAAHDGYHLEKTIAVSGDGGWDYLTVDEAARRVYVSHGTKVEVLDADSGERKGEVADTAGVHGIAIAAKLGRGFTSNGRSKTVTVFDLKSLKPLGTVPTGKNLLSFYALTPSGHRELASERKSWERMVAIIEALLNSEA